MANQVYLVPLRNDLDGANIQVTDLRPNSSQRNLIYDGAGQSGYLKWSLDTAGLTTVSGDTYVSGPTDTTPITAAAADDTTGGGNDVTVAGVAEFGLEAYLRDRVHADPGAGDTSLSIAQAATVAGNIRAALQAGTAITLAIVDAFLTAAVAAAATDLNGVGVALSTSFGSVVDILRILQGEVYRVRALSIIEDQAGAWLGLVARQVIVDAQTNAFVVAQGQFYAQGAFLAAGDPGHRSFLPLVRTGAFNISNGEGVIAGLKGAVDFNHPNFAYTAAEVTVLRLRAATPDGTAIPESGISAVLAVYDDAGNPL